jgi:tRNA threonylcarbamoyladenosine biosynthesis protein TsaB
VILLALSTSTPLASAAVVRGDRVLGEAAHEDLRGHAERLFGLVDAALAAAGCARADIGLVACDVGPGSFTGVRVAVASAKGIAVGLGVPLAGVVSLEAMAAHARSEHPECALVAAAIDAKKEELYVAMYDGETELLAPCHLPRDRASARVAEIARDRPFVSVADAPAFERFAGGAARTLVAPPSAAWIGRIAAARSIAPADPADVVPLYVRAPDAVPLHTQPLPRS